MSTPLVEELVRRGRLEPDQAQRLGGLVAERGGSIDTVILELGWTDEASILAAMGVAYGLSVASPATVRAAPDAAAVRAFPEQWARKHMLAPLSLDHDRGELSVLAIPPPDPAVLERLGSMLELRVVPLLTTELRVHERLSLLYGAPVPERYQTLLQTPSRRPSAATPSLPTMPPQRNSEGPLDNSLREAITRLRDATGRDEIIDQTLQRARRDFAFVAFFVVIDDKVTGRAASGMGAEEIQNVTLATTGRSSFANAVRNQAHVLGPLSVEDQRSLAVLGRVAPRTALIVPVRVRERTVGLIYADQGDHTVSPRAASDLMLFVNAVGVALEGLVMRKKGASAIGPAAAPSARPSSTPKVERVVSTPPRTSMTPRLVETTRPLEVVQPTLTPTQASAEPVPFQAIEPAVTVPIIPRPSEPITQPTLQALTGIDAAIAVPVIQRPPPPSSDTMIDAAPPVMPTPEPSVPSPAPPAPPPALRIHDEGAWAKAVGPAQSYAPAAPAPASPAPVARPEPPRAPPTPPPGPPVPAPRKPSRLDNAIDNALNELSSEPPPPPPPPDEDTDKIRKRPAPSERAAPRLEALPIPPLASETPGPSPADLAADLNEPVSAVRRMPMPRAATRRSLAPAPAAPHEDRNAWENHVSAVWAAFSQPPGPPVAPLMPISKHSMTPLPAEIVGDADSFPPGSDVGPLPIELRRETWVKASARAYRSGDTPAPVLRGAVGADEPRAIQGHIPVARGEPLPTEHSHVVTVSGRVEKKGHLADSEPPAERTVLVTRTGARDKMDYEILLDRLESVDPNVAATARTQLIEFGEAALPNIMRRYPGRLSFDPFGVSPLMPPLAGCGPLLDVIAQIGHVAHAWVAERLDDTLPAVRLISVHYYGTVRVPEVLPRLTRRLHDEEPRVANLAVTTLALYRDDRGFTNVLGHLHARLASPSANARRHAAKLLATLGDTSAVPLLAAIFDRKDKIVYDAVESALADLTKQRFGPNTKRWLTWWDTHRKMPRAEWLLEALEGPDADLRKAAADELRAASGIDPGFLENGPKKGRDDAKRRWQDWWAERSRRG